MADCARAMGGAREMSHLRRCVLHFTTTDIADASPGISVVVKCVWRSSKSWTGLNSVQDSMHSCPHAGMSSWGSPV